MPPPNDLFPKKRPVRIPSPLADLAILAGIVVAFIVVSLLPAFRVSIIEVTGQKKLNPEYIVDRTKRVMGERRLGLFPQTAYLYLETDVLASRLKSALDSIVPLESLTVQKRFPKTLQISLIEREPAAVLKTETGALYLDAHGVLTATVTDPDPGYPTIDETNHLLFATGDISLAPSVIAALRPLSEELERRSLGPVTFETPEVRCPFDAGVAEPEDRTVPIETTLNGNTNTFPLNSNAAVVELSPPAVPEIACDEKQQLQKSTELIVVTSERWRILLDTKRPVGETLQALSRALEGKLKNRAGLKHVDVRFLPRIYYQ